FLDLVGQLDVERLAGRHPERHAGAGIGLFQRHRGGEVDVVALEALRPALREAAGIAPHAAGERVPAGIAAAGLPTRLAAEARHEFLEDVLGRKAGAGRTTGTRTGAAAAEAGKAGIAVGVDLAAVIGPALVLVG